MRVNITKVLPKPWVPTDKPDADPLYTIHIEGQGEPQKTYDPALTTQGWHEAETFKSKSGKEYWRTPKENNNLPTATGQVQYKADPDKQTSIEWQACLKAAVETVSNYYSLAGELPDSLEDYKRDIVNAVVTFTKTIQLKPDEVVREAPETMTDQGDYAQVDQPPIESYEEPF